MQFYIFHWLFYLLIAVFSSEIHNEWPDWRGPDRDGTWNEKGIIREFNSDKIPTKWTVPVSAGYSGPTIEGGRVYLTDRINRPDEVERVLCFAADDGKLIWSHTYSCTYSGIGYPAGPRASVIIDGQNAYSLGAMGHAFCFDKKTGEIVWSRDLNSEYQIKMPIWGIAAAPLIVDEKIIYHIGGSEGACVVALHKETGEEIWRALDDDASYSAPILIEQAGNRVVVVWTGDHVAGLNPENGFTYWKIAFPPTRMIIGIATPVLYDNYLFVSSFYDGSLLIELSEKQLSARKVWQRAGKNERETDALHCCISTPLIEDDLIFGVDSYGQLRCLELLTGDRLWEDLTAVKPDRWANIHFIRNDKWTYMFNEQGELIIGQLTREGFEEIDRALLIEPTKQQLNRSGVGVAWAHPGFAYKHVFIRSDGELLCADLSE